MAARLLAPCVQWQDAPNYGLSEESELSEIQAALHDALGIMIENRANSLECSARHGELVGAVVRRQGD